MCGFIKTAISISQKSVAQLSRWIGKGKGRRVGWLAGGLEPDLPGNEPFPRPAMDRHSTTRQCGDSAV